MLPLETQNTEPEYLNQIAGPTSRPLYYYVGVGTLSARVLWRRRRYIAFVIGIAVVCSVVLALILPVEYTATAYLMPPDNSASMSQFALLQTLRGDAGGPIGSQIGSALGLKSPGQLYIRVLRSNTVADRVIGRFDLMKRYDASTHRGARERLAANSAFGEESKNGVIGISVTDRDPAVASQLANAYIDELNHTLLEIGTSAAIKERQYFEMQLASAKEELQRAAKEFGAFAGQNAALDIPEQGKAAVEAMALVQGQLIAAETELKGLLQTYNEGQGPVQTARARISELRSQIGRLGGKGSTQDNTIPNVKQLSSLGAPYLALYQRLRTQESVVEALSQQYELAKLQESRQVPKVQVLDTADIPERKSFPPRVLIVVGCAFLAFFLASAKVLLEEWWRRMEPESPWKKVLP